MADVIDQKLNLHQAAATLTAGFMTGVGPVVPADADFANPEEQKRIYTACEAHRIFYHWLCKSLTDSTWPTPGATATPPTPTPPANTVTPAPVTSPAPVVPLAVQGALGMLQKLGL